MTILLLSTIFILELIYAKDDGSTLEYEDFLTTTENYVRLRVDRGFENSLKVYRTFFPRDTSKFISGHSRTVCHYPSLRENPTIGNSGPCRSLACHVNSTLTLAVSQIHATCPSNAIGTYRIFLLLAVCMSTHTRVSTCESVDKYFFPSNCDRRLSQWSLINDDLRASKEEEEKGKEEVFLFDISAVIECVVDNTKSPLSSNPIYGQQRVDYIGTRRLP
ncbi:hypothetical protein HZH68_005057 [Vespula germanica]|uniref:Uncharacterized protein n=1 Tax=Vespula germanica TaxID=30212 RepID=A0A834KFB6_VESGE|nr:hypothetical protein HZH68_005057 [Vespula germanica]